MLKYLVNEMGLETEAIENMTRNEVFDELVRYEGLGYYAGYTIRNMVKQIYGIDLDYYQEYLDPQSVAEMDGLNEY